nr:hypothetical protein [Providencia sp. wls1922]
MDSNQATWDQGFGQITMLPVAAGGLPPKGQDFNGILNQISENIVYQSQGGRFKFSPEYAESIGGYPKGAILQSDDEKKEYQSLIDNNKVNFNTTSNISASWELVGAKYAIKTEVDLALLKKFDKENISGMLGNDQSKVPSLGLLTNEVGKLQPKGNYQPAGDYATNTALNNGLALKFDKTGGAITGNVSVRSEYIEVVGSNSTIRISPYQTRPMISTSIDGGGWVSNELPKTAGVLLNSSNISQSTGQSTELVVSQSALTKMLGEKQPVGNYATSQALSDGLELKFNKTGGVITGNVSVRSEYIEVVGSSSTIRISPYQTRPMISTNAGNGFKSHEFQDKPGVIAHVNTLSKGDNGYEVDNNTGLITQWGRVSNLSAGDGITVQFPIQFTSKCVNVSATLIRTTPSATTAHESVFSSNPSTSGFTIYKSGGVTLDAFWIARGY